MSQVPLLPSCWVPSPVGLVTGNKSKREAVPGQCRGRAKLFVWASPCWKPSASSQLARLLPACPGPSGWVAGAQGSCSGLGKRQAGLRFWWPQRAWRLRCPWPWPPAGVTAPRAGAGLALGSGLWVLCMEMGTWRGFSIRMLAAQGNGYSSAANSTHLPWSLETSSLAFSLDKVMDSFFAMCSI